jgi:hypothetical protein
MPILNAGGPAPAGVVALGPDRPVRLILLDLTGGRTMAVAIFDIGTSQPSLFDEHVAEVMPIIESFEFHSPPP